MEILQVDMIDNVHSASTAGGSLATTTTAAAFSAAFYSEVQQTFFDIRWALLFIALLIVTDFWTGLTASVRVRGEDFRISRALRRTLVKFCEYVSFVIFGVVLAKSVLEPFGICSYVTGGAVGAACALLIECDSIYGHVCDIHGIGGRFSLKRLIVAWLRRKNRDLADAVEETLKETDKTNKKTDK